MAVRVYPLGELSALGLLGTGLGTGVALSFAFFYSYGAAVFRGARMALDDQRVPIGKTHNATQQMLDTMTTFFSQKQPSCIPLTQLKDRCMELNLVTVASSDSPSSPVCPISPISVESNISPISPEPSVVTEQTNPSDISPEATSNFLPYALTTTGIVAAAGTIFALRSKYKKQQPAPSTGGVVPATVQRSRLEASAAKLR